MAWNERQRLMLIEYPHSISTGLNRYSDMSSLGRTFSRDMMWTVRVG